MKCTAREWLRVTTVLFMARAIPAMVVPNATLLEKLLEKYMDEDGEWWTAKQRGKRAITDNDMQSILDLHNKLRSQVYPTASNMEYMVRTFFKWYVQKKCLFMLSVSSPHAVLYSLIICFVRIFYMF